MVDWITTTEAAAISGYHPYYLRELIRKGKVNAEKKGNSWWVKRQSLLEYLDSANKAKGQDKRHGPKSSNDQNTID